MKVLIITGGSKGIGLALANHYTNKGFKVFSLARTLAKKVTFNQLKVDLINADLTAIIPSILNEIKSEITKITLINNAGTLGEIANLDALTPKNISETIYLNTTVPLQLTATFIKQTKILNCKKTIITISSGAGTNAYQGWSVYCTSKAAINMMTKVIALENKDYTVLAIKPGVVATTMQKQIRKTDKNNFNSVEKFIALHKNNQLKKPSIVAQKIYEIDIKNLSISGNIIALT